MGILKLIYFQMMLLSNTCPIAILSSYLLYRYAETNPVGLFCVMTYVQPLKMPLEIDELTEAFIDLTLVENCQRVIYGELKQKRICEGKLVPGTWLCDFHTGPRCVKLTDEMIQCKKKALLPGNFYDVHSGPRCGRKTRRGIPCRRPRHDCPYNR